MNAARPHAGFTLLELLAAVASGLVLTGAVLAVTAGTLNLWRRVQDGFTAEAQAKIVLDHLARDLQAAVFQPDGQTWLAADILQSAASLANHGWLASPGLMKPATAESRRYFSTAGADDVMNIAGARFGLSGVWLRLVTSNVEAGGSLPVTVSYQLVRRPLSGGISTGNPADVRYTLFRSAVATDQTFINGYDVLAAAYRSTSGQPGLARQPPTLTNPHTTNDALATNVVDFGVWLFVRNPDGSLRRIFPASETDDTHAARGTPSADDASRFPDIALAMLRILTEQGATLIAAMENPGSGVVRPAQYASDAEWWWAVVEANSRVFVQQLEIQTAPP